MNREMGHINVLAGEIGFRVATTEGERRAASYIEQEFERYGLREIRQEAFPCTSEATSRMFPYLLAAIGSSLLAPFAPLAGLGGMLAAPAGLIGEMRANRGPVAHLANKGTSQNVIGILPASGERKAQVVLMAHYDSVRVRGYMKPRQQRKSARRFLMPLTGISYLTAIGASITSLLARRSGNRRLARSTRQVAGIAGATLLTTTLPLLLGQAIPGFDGEGANDNASGVAVLLSLAEQMAAQPLEHTEVWFVATGAEETGLNGARALDARYGKTLKDAYFFAIDTVGTGRLHYTTQERFMRRSDVPYEVIDILVTASEKGQHHAMPISLRAGATDATTMLDKRYKAASICCLLDKGKWPEINWPTDVRTYVEPETPAKATAFVKDILHEVDGRICYNSAEKNPATNSR
ncbi:MAG: M20/M25/M40 family metallo-hydrolase [Chloroflexota bacterium]|nr:M20/M25/M40 family metallo-hydrolase [Chloroflexota bacterium]